MPTVGTWIIIGLLVVIVILLVSVLVSQRKTREAIEEQRSHPDEMQILARELRQNIGGLALSSAQRAAEETVLALGYSPQTQLTAEPYDHSHPSDGYTGEEPVPDTAQWATDEAPEAPHQYPGGLDHPGARAQFAERTGRPMPDTGDWPEAPRYYEQVATGQLPAIVTSDSHAPAAPQPAAPTGPAHFRDDDTATFSSIGPDGEPPEFHASNFQRQPGESEADYQVRVYGSGGLDERYRKWLAQNALEVTGGFPLGIGYTRDRRELAARPHS